MQYENDEHQPLRNLHHFGGGVTIGSSLLLIAVGAILKWAVTARVTGISLQHMGVILIVVGAVALGIGLYLLIRSGLSTDPRADSR
jgi:hypothetical protein